MAELRKSAKYICVEGIDGVGKTTQCAKLATLLRTRGYTVLETKEPGTPLSPITLHLREIMLEKSYDNQLTPLAREYISQAIRSIHLKHVVEPALETHDFIIQDRGMLSGLAYGRACGIAEEDLEKLLQMTSEHNWDRYDELILFKTKDVAKFLERAGKCKPADAMEARGAGFIGTAALFMDEYSTLFSSVTVIEVTEQDTISNVFDKLLIALNIV